MNKAKLDSHVPLISSTLKRNKSGTQLKKKHGTKIHGLTEHSASHDARQNVAIRANRAILGELWPGLRVMDCFGV